MKKMMKFLSAAILGMGLMCTGCKADAVGDPSSETQAEVACRKCIQDEEEGTATWLDYFYSFY